MQKRTNAALSVILCGLLVADSAVLGATGQHSAGASTTPPAVQSATAQPGGGPVRSLAASVWAESLRNRTSAFTFTSILSVFAEQREVERYLHAYTVTEELAARWSDARRRAAQETEIDQIHASLLEVWDAYEELAAEYKRLVEERTDRGTGLLGMIASLGVNIVVSAIPGAGPVVGTAVAAGFSTAIDGGSFEKVLFAMGLAAGASFVAQEVSAAMLQDADLTQAAVNQAAAGASVASFTVAQTGSEFIRGFSQGRSSSFSPARQPGAASAPGLPLAHRRTSDAAYAVGDPPRRGTATAPEGAASPAAAPRPPASLRSPQVSPARLFDSVRADRLRERGHQPALNGLAVIDIHAQGREIDKVLFQYQVERESNDRTRRALESMARVAETINLWADHENAVEAHEELLGQYEQLLEEIRNSGGGLLGSILGLVGTVGGTLVGGPLVGAALAGAIGTLGSGGSVGEALVAAGFNLGATYAYSVAVPALNGVLVGSPEADHKPTWQEAIVDAALAHEIDSLLSAQNSENSHAQTVSNGGRSDGTPWTVERSPLERYGIPSSVKPLEFGAYGGGEQEGAGHQQDGTRVRIGDQMVTRAEVRAALEGKDQQLMSDIVAEATSPIENLKRDLKEYAEALNKPHHPNLHTDGTMCVWCTLHPIIGPLRPLDVGEQAFLESLGVPRYRWTRSTYNLLRHLTWKEQALARARLINIKELILNWESASTHHQRIEDARRLIQRHVNRIPVHVRNFNRNRRR